jgi:glutamine cyclotransferase
MSRRKRGKGQSEASPPPEDAGERRSPWIVRHRWGVLAAVLCCACACVVGALVRDPSPAVYTARVVREFPHDSDAYTQGLVYEDGTLFEGTGKRGKSTLRQVELETGKILQLQSLDDRLFGEGIAIWNDRIIQLTWTARFGIVYDKKTFRELDRFRYSGQGWGLTHDGTHLIMSDGTSSLRFLDPKTFDVIRTLRVHDRGRRVHNLNELEFVNGEVLANVWGEDYIVRIAPGTGQITGYIDLRNLWPRRSDPEAVLNGIAYDAAGKRLFVTGKNWPKLYEIELVPR